MRRTTELQANLELPRSVARTLEAHVKDILRQELFTGTSFISLETGAVERGERHFYLVASEYSSVRNFNRLERILTNLIANALKYSEAPAEVTVRLVGWNGEVVTSVSDQGPGIPPEDLPHLFQRSHRMRQGRYHKEGLGLGLYITNRSSRPTAGGPGSRAVSGREAPSASLWPWRTGRKRTWPPRRSWMMQCDCPGQVTVKGRPALVSSPSRSRRQDLSAVAVVVAEVVE